MPTITRTFTVARPPAAVLSYLEDFSRAEEWDPGTVSCRRLDEGPVQVGSRWHNESKIAGVTSALEYTLEERTDELVAFRGVNDTATTTDTISVRPDGTGSEITYEAVIALHGAAKLASPAMKLIFEKVGNEVVENLTRVLGEQ